VIGVSRRILDATIGSPSCACPVGTPENSAPDSTIGHSGSERPLALVPWAAAGEWPAAPPTWWAAGCAGFWLLAPQRAPQPDRPAWLAGAALHACQNVWAPLLDRWPLHGQNRRPGLLLVLQPHPGDGESGPMAPAAAQLRCGQPDAGSEWMAVLPGPWSVPARHCPWTPTRNPPTCCRQRTPAVVALGASSLGIRGGECLGGSRRRALCWPVASAGGGPSGRRRPDAGRGGRSRAGGATAGSDRPSGASLRQAVVCGRPKEFLRRTAAAGRC